MFDKINEPDSFPLFLTTGDEELCIESEGHYKYLNSKADKLYQTIYGYKSQPNYDYYCSSHPQERNCFVTALVMDKWCAENSFD